LSPGLGDDLSRRPWRPALAPLSLPTADRPSLAPVSPCSPRRPPTRRPRPPGFFPRPPPDHAVFLTAQPARTLDRLPPRKLPSHPPCPAPNRVPRSPLDYARNPNGRTNPSPSPRQGPQPTALPRPPTLPRQFPGGPPGADGAAPMASRRFRGRRFPRTSTTPDHRPAFDPPAGPVAPQATPSHCMTPRGSRTILERSRASAAPPGPRRRRTSPESPAVPAPPSPPACHPGAPGPLGSGPAVPPIFPGTRTTPGGCRPRKKNMECPQSVPPSSGEDPLFDYLGVSYGTASSVHTFRPSPKFPPLPFVPDAMYPGTRGDGFPPSSIPQAQRPPPRPVSRQDEVLRASFPRATGRSGGPALLPRSGPPQPRRDAHFSASMPAEITSLDAPAAHFPGNGTSRRAPPLRLLRPRSLR